jgi:hypothetical protein
MDLSIVIVSWNVKDFLQRCLASLAAEAARSPFPSFQTIVVDNASSDSSQAMVRSGFPNVELIANEYNLGFTRSNNQGIAASRGRHLLLLNPDAEVQPGALASMVSYLDEHPEVGVLGPQLLNPDGSIQSSRRRFPTLATAFVESTVLQRYFPRARLLWRYYCEDHSAQETQEVDWVVGACMMVRRQAVEEVGPLDESFFMYSEELDWCYRMKQAGWKVVYLPEAKVVHHYAKSSSQDLPRQHIYFADSKCRFFRKHRGALAAEALRLFLLATYLFQFGEEGAKYLLGHKRPLRRERLGLLLRVLRSGLRARLPDERG